MGETGTVKVRFLLVACFMLAGAAAQAAIYDLEVLPQSGDLNANQPFAVTIKGQWPTSVTVASLDYAAAASAFEVRDVQVSSRAEAGMTLYQVVLRLEVPREGPYVFPALQLPLLQQGRPVATAESNRLFLEIPEGAAAAADLRGNKPLQRLAWELTWLWWLLGAIVLLVLGVVLWRWRRVRQLPAPVDPYQEWLSGLREVRDTGRPDALVDKQTAFALSHTMRRYMERRSPVTALEMTGAELSRALARGPAHVRQRWSEFVARCQALESVKYRPGAVGEQTIAEWTAALTSLVDALEAEIQADTRAGEPDA